MYRVGPRVQEVQTELGGVWEFGTGFVGDPFMGSILDRRKDFKGYPMKGVGVNVCFKTAVFRNKL